MLKITSAWKEQYPQALAGVLAMRSVHNPAEDPRLEKRKENLEKQLRETYGGLDRRTLRGLPRMAAYHSYYRPFRKTYHVQAQLESVATKGKPIPRIAALVEAMFMSELKNHLLTAGHDLDRVRLPLRLDVAAGSETYLRINGEHQVLKAGDMLIADQEGILSCILYGPDRRTRIRSSTTSAVFTTYAPAGIQEDEVRDHLTDLQNTIKLFSPDAETITREIFGAGAG